MPLLEKVRIELFIPDLPDPIYARLLEEFGNELSYAFGGCTVISTQGKYRSTAGSILPDKINILFTDTPFRVIGVGVLFRGRPASAFWLGLAAPN